MCILDHDLDLLGSCDVTIRFPYAICYWWSFGTKHL